ncbi:hypothetical protein [Azotobacter vinelandii]|uniref:hypothetical protein n=1 Tax=Azotobacter vinelandii TaxID=354 RepID=UPI0009225C0E|nr:hypothetical protein [Azotobacter vinelandii]WKN23181.1 hypothetical protein AVAEIV_001217 [Azotobacter vinelandii]SFY09209.1 hypothetical protein SAMN04244547_03952 [Azotobacter vinelandii]
MSQSLSYRFGVALGTVTREVLSTVRQPQPRSTPQPNRSLSVAPHPSGQILETICRVPAFVRLNKVDLNTWYEQNTRELRPEKTKRKRTNKPKPKTAKTADSVEQALPKLGSLNDLIAPVEPLI